jgi:hypothetical protein
MGLRIGILIRGGLSFGEMFHQEGVVLGEAMVDAAELEKTMAVNPRVIVSERVIKKLSPKRPEDCWSLLRDADRRWHLDYFTQMMHNAASRRDDGGDSALRLSPRYLALMEADLDIASRWKRAHLDRIEQEIDGLRRADAAGPAAKWEWFDAHFQSATQRIP